MKIEVTAFMPAPPPVVAEVLVSADDAPRWQAGLERMEVVRGDAGTPGALARLHYVEKGRSYVMEDELLECDPGTRWRSRVSGNGMSATVETRLEPTVDGTQLVMSWDGSPDAAFARAFFWLARGTIRRGIEADLRRLRALVSSRFGSAPKKKP